MYAACLLESNAVVYKTILRSDYSSMADYQKSSGMRYVDSWATEVEIQVAADYLGLISLHITMVDG